MRAFATYLAVASVVLAQPVPLSKRIDALLRRTPEVEGSFWGISILDLGTGRAVYSLNPKKAFIPASNMKLFSTALALTRLGADYRFTTRLTSSTAPDSAGRIPELRLVGGGDPNLSARLVPYTRGKRKENAFEVIEQFADAAVAKGIRWVDGDIVGDDTAYLWEPYPEGWTVDDTVWEYGAGVSALTLNDNAFRLTVEPGLGEGTPVRFTLWPAFEHLVIHNRTRTVLSGPSTFRIVRLPGSDELTLLGDFPMNGSRVPDWLAVDDPALFAAEVLKDALQRRGIRVSGVPRAIHRSDDTPLPTEPGIELAQHRSAPLSEVIQIVNKESQNLHAEILLREVARAAQGVGTHKGGLDALKVFLTEIGVDPTQYSFEDGSGLSRKALVTPTALITLLRHMYASPFRDVWSDSMPVGGVDGTLSNRFDGIARSGVRAKTGTVGHVSALSGYASHRSGKIYAFAILVNNYNSPAAPVRRLIDRIVLELLK